MLSLSPRLAAVASLVKKGSRIADIGTDHGYIPVYLCQSGTISSAVAADINEGPLSSCAALVKREGLDGVISTRLSNGLENIAGDEYDTLIIAGMGGELISKILSSHPLCDKHIILNPMTHPELARKHLYDNGFVIDNDFIVREGRHCYCVLDAYYTGEIRPRDTAEYYLGNITDFSEKEYFLRLIKYLGDKQRSGRDFSCVIANIKEKL